ncbi:hypothetical protein GN244_ATG01647 [Phytophthora infestans]|uniref:Uncharacterized protein n=1 Tax=Phytophthora infestans TaxID=4787 RepID=A0A833W7W4_PHYIN|nr:hypothetical protein GN244_ATG01647 [Phytophthora infestans]KAF4134517.1 hypothetical protein GN958_ATG16305 [Phytophthora infestans]
MRTIRADPTIYLKPSLGAKQAEWVALTVENWKSYVKIARSHYSKRKKSTGPFTFDVFVFADREASGVGIRRVTSSRITEAANAIDEAYRCSSMNPLHNHLELRVALGLPSHNFMGEGMFASFRPSRELSEDMSDRDHMSD